MAASSSYNNTSQLFEANKTKISSSNTPAEGQCAASFTTAQKPTNLAVTKQSGVTEIKSQDEQTGAIQYRIVCDNGPNFGVDESGAIILVSAKTPADNNESGNFKWRCAGKTIWKIGNELHIEVENKAKHENPLSIYINGNVNIQAQGGNLGLSGKNVNINAADTCTINAGRTIQFNAGQGGAGSAVSAVKNAINGVDAGTAGGRVEINAGEIIQKSSAKTSNVNVTYENVSSERALEMKDPRGTFKISSLGHMEFSILGDYVETIYGKRSTKIYGKPSLPMPHPNAPKDTTWDIQLGATSESPYDLKLKAIKGSLDINAPAGKFDIKTGLDFTLKSLSGGLFTLSSKNSGINAYANLVLRATNIAQFGTANTSFMQTDSSGTKIIAPIIYLN
jgi:hypothetical protein